MSEDLHVRGMTLLDGQERDIFVRAKRISFEEQDDARTLLDDAYIIPGLVDTHAHLPFASPAPENASWEEKARASARIQLEAGVLAVRDPGGPTPPGLDGEEGLPHIITAGRFLAAPGRAFPDKGQIELPAEQIPQAAEDQVKSSGAWVKLIGDYPVPGKGLETSFLAETISEVVRRVHALGGRVAIHAVHVDTIENAIEAGVDSIEHGVMLRRDQMAEMARQGIVLVPTMISMGGWLAGALNQIGVPDNQIENAGDAVANQAERVRAAWEAGVTLLAGTDASAVAHGLVGDEIRLLMATGMDVSDALAAGSWRARTYLGLPGIEEGAPADLVAYKRDPLKDPTVLDEPALILRNGRVVHAAGVEPASTR